MKVVEKFALVMAFAALSGTQIASAAVMCVQNKNTGKFEEKGAGKKVTGECEAQSTMNLLSTVGDVEVAVAVDGTRVIGGVIVTNAAKPFSMPAEPQARSSAASLDAPASSALEQRKVVPREVVAAPETTTAAVPVWSLLPGRTVGQELRSWGEQAGWKVVWNMSKDWSVPASTSFPGDFKAAATGVIQTLAANGALVRAQFFDGNKTMVVTGPGVAAQ
jgi:hypothetical protein